MKFVVRKYTHDFIHWKQNFRRMDIYVIYNAQCTAYNNILKGNVDNIINEIYNTKEE